MNKIRLVMATSIFAPAILLALVAPVQAMLIGDTIQATGNELGPGSAIIGPDIEFHGVGNLAFDFGTHTLTVSEGDGSINGWNRLGNYVFAGFEDGITSVSIFSNTGFSGKIINNFSFDAHSITLDMSSGTRTNNSVVVFDINQSSVALPEPATDGLISLGLIGLAYTWRKRTGTLSPNY